jgi:hypothetical protein
MQTSNCTSRSAGFGDTRSCTVRLGHIVAIVLVSLVRASAYAQSVEDQARQTQQDAINDAENCRLGLASRHLDSNRTPRNWRLASACAEGGSNGGAIAKSRQSMKQSSQCCGGLSTRFSRSGASS